MHKIIYAYLSGTFLNVHHFVRDAGGKNVLCVNMMI